MPPSSLVTTVRVPGFVSFLTVAFINAMVDIGHKIIIQNILFKIYDDAQQVALTAVVNALILLPFILLFTPAGFLSDRFRKTSLMKWSALAAVVITLFITLAYYQGWFITAFAMTFILAAQSALYSPAKYGYVRELVGEKGLSAGNGYAQSVSIIAILSGIFIFSILFEMRLSGHSYIDEADLIQHIAPLGWGLVLLSSLEFILACRLPQSPINNTVKFDWSAYRKGHLLKQNLIRMHGNQVIWFSILALSLFWGVSQTFLATFPAFAKLVLTETNTVVVQGLLACSGIGIMLGSLMAGRNHSGQIETKWIKWGAAGMLVVLFIIPQLHHLWLFALLILLFGFFGGLFIIPLNALIQLHAPQSEAGKVLAGNNWIQNLVMISCLLLTFLAAKTQISSQWMLAMLPILVSLVSFLLLKRIQRAINLKNS